VVNTVQAETSKPEGKPILIVTITKVEAQAVLEVFPQAAGSTNYPRKRIGKITYYEIGFCSNVPVLMVRSRKGVAGPGGSLLTVRQAIQDINPQAIILCGTAFGLKPNEQKIGDILISEQVECYESQKVDENQGRLQLGDRVTASTNLLDLFQSADHTWKDCPTHFGLIMSGEKLVNDPSFCEELLQISPKAIGGEMEAAGLYVSASDAKVDWIIAKAICDWGDGHKNDDAQEQAARNAARFVLHVLQQGGFEKPVSTPNGNYEEVAHSSSTGEEDSNDPEQYWLREVGLKENPFRHWNAEERDPYLPDYFSRSIALQQVTAAQLTREKKIWFFGGDEGYGKTTLRKFLAAKGRPIDKNSEMLCFEIDQLEFERLVPQLDEIPNFSNLFFRAMSERCLHLFPGESLDMPLAWHNQGKALESIAHLSSWLRERGIDWILCLIDPSRESFTWRSSPIPTISFLEPLINFPESGGVGLRFFLPTSVKDELMKKFPPNVKNEYRYMQIEWDEASLMRLIAKRMTTLSTDQTAPLRSLGQVCDSELAPLVDQEIAKLAQGCPRAAVWLANRLVEVHCQEVPRPPDVITQSEWEMVKTAWWEGGESWILGESKPSKFLILGKRVFYQKHEIILGGRSNQLLCCMVSAKDGFRLNQELIESGWPNENPDGVTEKALSEAIRRMKNELIAQLKKYGVDTSGSKWIKKCAQTWLPTGISGKN
jgi:nucleoside phosphorylase